MVLLVHGFPNSRSALYFEWCWQHPQEAKGLREELPKLKHVGNQHHLKAKINVMKLMITLPLWNKFPLTIYWLTDKYHCYLDQSEVVPNHMSTQIGKLEDLFIYKEGNLEVEDENELGEEEDEDDNIWDDETYQNFQCYFCSNRIDKGEDMICTSKGCYLVGHISCFGLHFLSESSEKGQLMPTIGKCPKCTLNLKWSTLVTATRKRNKV